MDNVQVDLITRIPDEIKLLIFQNLDSFSIITLVEVSKKFQEVSLDEKLSSNLCFYMDYRFKLIHLQSFLLHKLRKEIITSLNINCVYWIPKDQMKGCLSLPMLKSLYALDTKLDLNDIYNSNVPNLNVLAITEGYGSLPSNSVLKNLKKLYLQLRQYHFSFMIMMFNCTNLEELWLLDLFNGDNGHLLFNCNIASRLKRFVTNVAKCEASRYLPPSFSDYSPYFNAIAFASKRGIANICLENTNMNISNIYKHNFYEGPENVLWATYLIEFKCDFPFGFHDAKKLVYKQETLDSLYFQELALNHKPHLCCEKLQSTVVSILALPNTKLLRKLSINICIIDDYSNISDINEPLCKRSRTTKDCMKKSKLDVIVEHLPLLEDLEFWMCTTTHGWNPIVLRSIGKLPKLKSLILHGVFNMRNRNGKYLLDICKSCANLTSLKIWSSQNSYLNNTLCMSIPYLRMLKDLRYDHHYLSLDRILESLSSNDSHKLERVVLMCDETETLSLGPLKKFITQNPQLKLLYIAVANLSEEVGKDITKDLNEMKSDQQIFIVTNNATKSLRFLPLIHKLGMLDFTTSVGVIHPFNHFH